MKTCYRKTCVMFFLGVLLLQLAGCIPTLVKQKSSVALQPLDSVEELMQITFVPSNELNPEVSPEGKRLAFVSDTSGDDNIFVSDLMGRNPRQMTYSPFMDGYPNWSRNGKELFFSSNRLGFYAIFKKNISRERETLSVVARGGNDIMPAISPGSKILAFSANNGGHEALWLAYLNSGKLVEIGEGGRPRWSGDGREILVHASKKGSKSDIWIVSKNGNDVVQLTVDEAEDISPSWSPDGKKVVFASNRSGNYDIWLLNLEDKEREIVQLTNNPAEDGHPVWTPDGKYIYFHSTRSGNYDLWRIKPAL